jgi:hypothetical protein
VISRAQRAIEQHLFKSGPDPLAPTDFELRPAAGCEAELTVWLAASDPPRAGNVIELRYGSCAEPAEPAFRRAIASDDPVVVTEARLLVDGVATKVVARAVSGVRPFSLASGLNLALWRSATLARRAAETLPGLDEPVRRSTSDDRRPVAKLPVFVRLLSRWGRVLLTRLLFRRPWRVHVRKSGSDLAAGWGGDAGLVRWHARHSYADPILFERDGRHHLFVEDVPPGANGRGRISHVELDTDGHGRAPVSVLEASHHLSYPFVFSYGEEVYMVPETGAASQIQLYRASEFPTKWEFDRVLIDDIYAADATLLEQEGTWWMFASVGDLGTTLGDELHLFLADTPLGPWTPHPGNPIVSDIRCARAAGPVFRDGDRLIRPAQDGSRRYGWAVSLREILALTPDRYEERELARLEPSAVEGARAVHTYARDSRFEAIDARRREWRPALSVSFASWRAARRRARSRG